jgi:group I intron endonuclease
MFYTVYKTTNLINGKYYFGVHRTEDPYDGYLGSGKIILKAVVKYGKQAFKKDVLFIYPYAEQAFSKEKELVSAFKIDPFCYNLRDGGAGEFKRPPTSEETRAKLRASHKGKTLPLTQRQKIGHSQEGRTVSEEIRQKIRKSLEGRKRPPEVGRKTAASLRARTKYIQRICPECGIQFTTRAAKTVARTFCSKSCSGKYARRRRGVR